MTPPGRSIEFIEQALRDIFVSLLLDGLDATDIRIMAESESEAAIAVFNRDYGSKEVSR